MRIISGNYKGRRIPVRKGFPSRPTTDFAKENIFNVIHNEFDFEDLAILDLFAGTGSISYEFASRGCGEIIAIESDSQSIDFIRSTSKQLGIENIKTIKMDTFKYLEKTDKKFDIVFADPPYNLDNLSEIPEKVFSANIIHPGGWLILEHGRKHQFNGFQKLIGMRTYGSVHFSIFEEK